LSWMFFTSFYIPNTHTHIYIYYRDCWFLDALLQPSLDGYSMGTRSLGRPDFWEEAGD
jgi:hypothetical protein